MKSPLKVLQLGKFYHPSFGGIETVLKNISEGLVKTGNQVTVLCSSQNSKGGDEWINGVRVIRAPCFGSAFSQPICPSLALKLIRILPEFDVVQIHTPHPFTEGITSLLPERIPLVASYHSDVIRQKLLLPFYKPLLMKFLRRADRIVVATPNHIQHSPYLSMPDVQPKCRVIPYGLDPARFVASTTPQNQFGAYVLFVGRLVSYKGVHTLIEAIRQTPFQLVIVGEGPCQSELEALAKTLRIEDRVHFMGKVESEVKMASLFSDCRIFVLPSITRAEAFGVVQLEAMAYGKPVIVSRLDSGVTLVNQDGVTGLHVEPRNSHDLAQAITRLMTDEPLRAKLGEAARTRFLEEYTFEKMVQRYSDLFFELHRYSVK